VAIPIILAVWRQRSRRLQFEASQANS
jgi:hypothetical protein